MARGSAIAAPIVAYVESRRGEMVTLDEILATVPDTQPGSVQRVMLDLVRREIGLEVINQGRVWRLNPLENGAAVQAIRPAAKAQAALNSVAQAAKAAVAVPEFEPGDLFEYVGSTREGAVLRDKAGALWSARKM